MRRFYNTKAENRPNSLNGNEDSIKLSPKRKIVHANREALRNVVGYTEDYSIPGGLDDLEKNNIYEFKAQTEKYTLYDKVKDKKALTKQEYDELRKNWKKIASDLIRQGQKKEEIEEYALRQHARLDKTNLEKEIESEEKSKGNLTNIGLESSKKLTKHQYNRLRETAKNFLIKYKDELESENEDAKYTEQILNANLRAEHNRMQKEFNKKTNLTELLSRRGNIQRRLYDLEAYISVGGNIEADRNQLNEIKNNYNALATTINENEELQSKEVINLFSDIRNYVKQLKNNQENITPFKKKQRKPPLLKKVAAGIIFTATSLFAPNSNTPNLEEKLIEEPKETNAINKNKTNKTATPYSNLNLEMQDNNNFPIYDIPLTEDFKPETLITDFTISDNYERFFN